MAAREALRVRLPVPPPCVLLFAPSMRSPDYEIQQNIILGAPEETRSRLPPVVELFPDGESRAAERRLDAATADQLRQELGVHPSRFRLVLIGTDGTVTCAFDTPTKASALLDALERGRDGR